MKLNLIADEQNLNEALEAYYVVIGQQPFQDIGESVKVALRSNSYSVTRNKDSYTSEQV